MLSPSLAVKMIAIIIAKTDNKSVLTHDIDSRFLHPLLQGSDCLKTDNKEKKPGFIKYIVGSIILFAAASYVVPKLLPLASAELNKYASSCVNSKKNEDDWGPVIEKKDAS